MTTSDEIRHLRENSRGWHIQRLARSLDRWMGDELARHDLTHAQFAILMCCLEQDGLTQAEIGKQFSMPAYTISRAIDALQVRDLVKRCSHPGSRRANLICPTEAALALAPTLRQIVDRVNTRLVAPLSDNEADQFLSLLHKLYAPSGD